MKEYIVQLREGSGADGWTIVHALDKVLPPESYEVFSRSDTQPSVQQTALHVRVLNVICYGITSGSLLWLFFGRP